MKTYSQNPEIRNQRSAFWLMIIMFFCAIACDASTLPTNSVNGHVLLSWTYPTNLITDDLRFNLYQTTNITQPFVQLTNVAATNFAPYQVSFDGTNWMANLSVRLDLQPAPHFFVSTSSNFWGETSITSNVVVTPAAPQVINDSLHIQKTP